MTVDNPMQYPQLAAPTGQGGFLWTNVELNDTVGEVIETVNGWLHRAVVRMTFTIILPYI
jgi:hypothetical protein